MKPAELKKRLAGEATRLDRVMRDDLGTAIKTGSTLAAVLDHALFAGGKRIRPLLTILAAQLTGGVDNPGSLPQAELDRLAIAFEYLHAASLLHDDVIDHARLRRGRETVNTRWANEHAILAGDFLHARAMLLAGTIGGVHCLELIGAATQAMVESEFIQMEAAASADDREETYFKVLAGKTAALIAAACECGVVAAGGTAAQRQALRTYGANLGLAFQIIDDLLDYQGEPAATGKAVGNDLQEGKMTLPLIYALERAAPAQRDWLREILTIDPDERLSHFASVSLKLAESGAFAACLDRAADLIKSGFDGLAGCLAPTVPAQKAEEALALLGALGRYVLTRKR
ncbi:MAG TPA: polyprenyl synthetase family protein [Desulfurivibrio alkaliphilus]|uniref:Polyprenyl synthetase family protein n=1 Tax=Desulfurivibrio alkaliphilus TaxID=427923 RepID=A0A7C2X981_9BACT|nr:polyprenyl synthetase family protein [Desulfurivibrio alkaliphilus]